jgi:hypothetical protein
VTSTRAYADHGRYHDGVCGPRLNPGERTLQCGLVIDRATDVITLGSCGGCESASPVTLSIGAGPQRVFLDAGPHYFRLEASTATHTALSLQLRRVD